MKKSFKTQYKELSQVVYQYVSALRSIKAQTAGVFPAYGKPGEENSPTKAQPNVVFVKDLINQVQTAQTLGYRTELTANAGELFINFIEKTPTVPTAMQCL